MEDELKLLSPLEFKELCSDLEEIIIKWEQKGFEQRVTGSCITQFIANKIVNGVFANCSDTSQIIDEVEREAHNISILLSKILEAKLAASLQSGSESKN